MNKYYAGKWALITGGSEGIGFALAEEMLKKGSHVVIVSRSAEKLSRAVCQLQKAKINSEQKIESLSVDVTQYAQVEAKLSVWIDKNGCPDFLVNCAGYARPGYLDQLEVEHFHKMMELNYFGVMHVCKVIVPHMIQRRSGVILNTSSMAGFIGLFGYTGYCASKFAVVGFSWALKNELKPFNLQVSVLCPPNTRTPGLEQENLFKPKEVLQTEEKVKVLSATEVAQSALKSLARKTFMIVPTADGQMAYWLGRFSPSILDQFVKRPKA